MPDATESYFDTVVVDRESHPVALVQVKGQSPGGTWIDFLPRQLHAHGQPVPFVMLVDPACIDLFQWDGSALTGPVAHLPTPAVLRHYEPEFGNRRIFKSYLQTLVEAWLRDLAYHWNSEVPPGSEELRRVGLLGRLEGGTTHSIGG